ncbi:PCRF domain-containing protein [Microgenomates group bacterium]|nr:PCRF domain-containing protein [Microgenomates group bacterium]
MPNPYQAQLDHLEEQIAANQTLLASDPDLNELISAEIADLETQKAALLEASLAYESSQSHSDADLPADITFAACIIEIRGGAGGDEAKIWGEELSRTYLRFAESLGLKVEFIDDGVLKIKGKTSQLLSGHTLAAYPIFQYESGVHRVQRVPITESQGRVHTSTASVAVLPEIPPTAIEIKEEDLDWQFMRASGAGGQNVNKVNSAVRLTHIPSGTIIVSRQERKQDQNREIALSLLRSKLWELEEEERAKKLGDARSVIGRADRSEKIRTYNFPQSRLTDHRLNQSWHNLPVIMEGDLTDVWHACYDFFNS